MRLTMKAGKSSALAAVLPAVQAAQAEKAAAMGQDAAFALNEMEDRACRSTFVRAMTGDGFRERLVAFSRGTA